MLFSFTDHKKQKGEIYSGHEHPKAKEARKEKKVLEKKMALNRKRKLVSKYVLNQMSQNINIAHNNRLFVSTAKEIVHIRIILF